MGINWKALYKKIPNAVQINRNTKYTIRWFRQVEELDHVGLMQPSIKQISLSLGLTPKSGVHTYIHEVIHAVSAEYDVNLSEDQVLALEKALYYILKKDNLFK